MIEFSLWDITRNLLLAARWTVVLSLLSFITGGLAGLFVLVLRTSTVKAFAKIAEWYIEFFQGTPLLMQLFLVYFGLPMLGMDVSPWTAALLGLTLSASAYLAEIWRGCVAAVPAGQWEAATALGLRSVPRAWLVIWPQALRIAVAPTVGFMGLMVKSTALTSIIGFNELLRTSHVITNATFEPFTVYGIVALIYLALCWPLNAASRALERRLTPG
ncbi:MAG TPA: amino acid ABC transporter permease [Ancylobacter sp.]